MYFENKHGITISIRIRVFSNYWANPNDDTGNGSGWQARTFTNQPVVKSNLALIILAFKEVLLLVRLVCGWEVVRPDLSDCWGCIFIAFWRLLTKTLSPIRSLLQLCQQGCFRLSRSQKPCILSKIIQWIIFRETNNLRKKVIFGAKWSVSEVYLI